MDEPKAFIPPKKNLTPLRVMVDKELKQKAKIKAILKGYTLKEVVTMLLKDFIREE